MKLRVRMVFDLRALWQDAPSAHVVVLPELADGGYAGLRRGEGVHTLGDGLVNALRELSRRTLCTCIAGSLPLRSPRGVLTNSSLVFRNGRCIHRYDKMHLFTPVGDRTFFHAGSDNAVFVVHGGKRRVRAGVIICYDLRFPELTRFLAAAGMQVLFVVARWPMVRNDAWQALLKARAIENQIFVVGCNAQGPEGGCSFVYDPLGRLVCATRAHARAQALEAILDLEALREARVLHTNLQDAVLLRRIRCPVGKACAA
jgi:omega-amidase